jgi:hypothetical protein
MPAISVMQKATERRIEVLSHPGGKKPEILVEK